MSDLSDYSTLVKSKALEQQLPRDYGNAYSQSNGKLFPTERTP